MDWISVKDRLPENGQAIIAKTYLGGEVQGVYVGCGEVVFDFWSGTTVDEFSAWKPRTPDMKAGHPYTAIQHLGAAALMVLPKEE